MQIPEMEEQNIATNETDFEKFKKFWYTGDFPNFNDQ